MNASYIERRGPIHSGCPDSMAPNMYRTARALKASTFFPFRRITAENVSEATFSSADGIYSRAQFG